MAARIPAMPTFPRLLVAMATPMSRDRTLDLDGAARLAEHLVDRGVGGLVVAGTTGESPTLSKAETLDLFRAVVAAVGGRASVIAGCGSNDTATTCDTIRQAATLGVDGLLLVAPYYNRPSQRGLREHFSAAAAVSDLPILVYNIPYRTGVEIEPQTLLQLAEDVPSIVGVKDSVRDFAKTLWVTARAPEHFAVWSGEDATLLPLLAAGGVGIVSVAAHLVPGDFAEMLDVFWDDPAKARAVAQRVEPLVAAIFAEPNPAPLKAGLELLGLPGGPVRAPLVDVTESTRELVRAGLAHAGIKPTGGTTS